MPISSPLTLNVCQDTRGGKKPFKYRLWAWYLWMEPSSCQTVSIAIQCSQHGGHWSDVTASLAQAETRTAQVSPVPRAWTERSLLMVDCTLYWAVLGCTELYWAPQTACFEFWRELVCHFDKFPHTQFYLSSTKQPTLCFSLSHWVLLRYPVPTVPSTHNAFS